jgi:hypothetical protein
MRDKYWQISRHMLKCAYETDVYIYTNLNYIMNYSGRKLLFFPRGSTVLEGPWPPHI